MSEEPTSDVEKKIAGKLSPMYNRGGLDRQAGYLTKMRWSGGSSVACG